MSDAIGSPGDPWKQQSSNIHRGNSLINLRSNELSGMSNVRV